MYFEEVLKIFGNNVKNQRKKVKFSFKELSEKSRIREVYLKKKEEGKAVGMPCSYIFLLGQALEIEPYELCEGI